MRIRLMREGVTTVDGRLIHKGGTTWPEAIPVQNTDSEIVAACHHIRREADGWITGDVDATRKDLRGFAAQANLADIETLEVDEGSETMVILSGMLKGIVLGKTPTWPGMVVT